MIQALLLLLLCQLGGEIAVRLSGAPVPGPVLGLVLLLILLRLRPGAEATVGPTADGLLRNLSLLFVPAGVGIVQHLDRLGEEALPLITALGASTVLALVVSAAVFAWAARRFAAAVADGTEGGQDR